MAPNKRRETIKMRVKNFLAIATLISLACTACTSDVYLGNPEDISQEVAISFDGGTGKSTRAEGSAAAGLLNNQFVVYGWKTLDNPAGTQTVFDHYNVNYTDGSAHSTLSNTAGWEYAGQAANALNSTLATTDLQDIKYWDFSATQYDFVAFSAGEENSIIKAGGDAPTAKQIAMSPIGPISPIGYSITGSTTDLTKVYIADRVTIDHPSVSNREPIQFAFRPLAAKVRIGLYETIPGYSVTDVKFYQKPISAAGEATPYLYAGSQTIPTGTGKVTVSFPVTDKALPAYNKAKVTYDSDSPKTEILNLTTFTANAAKEQNETEDGIYLGRTASTASKSADVTLIPP